MNRSIRGSHWSVCFSSISTRGLISLSTIVILFAILLQTIFLFQYVTGTHHRPLSRLLESEFQTDLTHDESIMTSSNEKEKLGIQLFDDELSNKIVALNLGCSYTPQKKMSGHDIVILFEGIYQVCETIHGMIDENYLLFCALVGTEWGYNNFYGDWGESSSVLQSSGAFKGNFKLHRPRNMMMVKTSEIIHQLVENKNTISLVKTDLQGYDEVVWKSIESYLNHFLCIKIECFCYGTDFYDGSNNYCRDYDKMFLRNGFRETVPHTCGKGNKKGWDDVLYHNPNHPLFNKYGGNMIEINRKFDCNGERILEIPKQRERKKQRG